MRSTLSLIALLLMLSVSAFAQVTAVPQLMNFQGRFARLDGTPVPDGTHSVRFSLWTAATGGTEKWNQTVNVTVRNGTFAALLDTSTGAADKFNNSLFLEIKIGTDAPLIPRQPLTSVAYAMKADSVKDGSITSASIANGSITAADIAAGTLNPLVWLLGGNSGTNGTQFLGTTDNQFLELRVNARRAMRYQTVDNPTFDYRSLNVLGGSELNTIDAGVTGAVIAGGGLDYGTGSDYPNRVAADFGTVSGGNGNTASGVRASIGGGASNVASGVGAAISGGTGNMASGTNAAIGGGGAQPRQWSVGDGSRWVPEHGSGRFLLCSGSSCQSQS